MLHRIHAGLHNTRGQCHTLEVLFNQFLHFLETTRSSSCITTVRRGFVTLMEANLITQRNDSQTANNDEIKEKLDIAWRDNFYIQNIQWCHWQSLVQQGRFIHWWSMDRLGIIDVWPHSSWMTRDCKCCCWTQVEAKHGSNHPSKSNFLLIQSFGVAIQIKWSTSYNIKRIFQQL